MRPIPKKLKEEMSDDSYYSLCCLRDISSCKGVIEWHHNLIYEGRQVNEKFCILPLCEWHHDHIHMPKLKGHADAIMIERATEEQINEYNLGQRKDYLTDQSPWKTVLDE